MCVGQTDTGRSRGITGTAWPPASRRGRIDGVPPGRAVLLLSFLPPSQRQTARCQPALLAPAGGAVLGCGCSEQRLRGAGAGTRTPLCRSRRTWQRLPPDLGVVGQGSFQIHLPMRSLPASPSPSCYHMMYSASQVGKDVKKPGAFVNSRPSPLSTAIQSVRLEDEGETGKRTGTHGKLKKN